ncbi:MAG: 30S ribosomal protein S8 [uncultured bacterium]|nr:MAG: 30S ribosomal protein S8 [uncultured bacterium]KKP68975.1 MAG: 30S ribosomal protein S8 [Candidatus Moranbacteria bacterium GW2011_GWE1_35_17]KKP72382.1 MAG: 30S ribosomal protein S8 [Candidatus Moranbacteria bacterium GW2011_GWE2_35_164]KKP84328.1 MAG: 30S ribosomal protein S8 [Candidatus Moranbacteria bacterium GW2011_GWF1_35_5]KKP84755.1 MAG: 30S ribosomal protein S8 [Candidatus Moranbacteria bacterium GW2011_GWF2_35_54]HBR78816.1 30S ribosomal protein S8 [Candidatus Moranbacteria b
MLDPISEMLTRIRNAQMAGHSEVVLASSKIKKAIASVLLKSGFVEGVEEAKAEKFAMLKINLKYINKEGFGDVVPAIRSIKRVSKEGQRIYVNRENIRSVKNGMGIAILSTSQGVVTGEEARKNGVGGELICEVW